MQDAEDGEVMYRYIQPVVYINTNLSQKVYSICDNLNDNLNDNHFS